MAFKLGMTIDVCMTAYMSLMLIAMTLTLKQGHSGLAEEKTTTSNDLDNKTSSKACSVSFCFT